MEAVPDTTARGRVDRPSTIADVARRARVGVGTVSRVLNASPSVSDDTRRRVLDVIAALDYRPSPTAQRLSRRRTHSIGVMAPFLTSPSLVERVRGVLDVLGPSDYDVVLHNVQTPAQRDEQFAALAHRGRADGLLAISLAPDDLQVERFQRAGVPVVLVDAVHPELPHIVIDDVEGGRLAAEHLLKLGHRRVAFVGDEPEDAFGFTSSMQRREGFRAALEAAGCELPEVLVREAQHGRENANRVTEELVMLAEAPTAIFAASDTQALGVLEALQRTGRSVPGDVSVIGFDDIDVAAYVGLTTVRQPLYRSGEHGARVLLDAISGAVQDPDERLTLELVERRTTGLKA